MCAELENDCAWAPKLIRTSSVAVAFGFTGMRFESSGKPSNVTAATPPATWSGLETMTWTHCSPGANPRLEPLPVRRNARIDTKIAVLSTKTEDLFRSQSPHPVGGPRVPGPPSTTDPGWTTIDVPSECIRLDAIARAVFDGSHAQSRIEQAKDPLGSLSVAERRVGEA